MDAGSNPASSTIFKGSDDLRALFFACDPRTTRGTGLVLIHILASNHKKTILSLVQVRSPAMRYSSQVKPISYLKANAAEVLTHLAARREPMVIHHPKR